MSLARALVVEPETLLLDEPLSNLDANLREEMRFEIRRLHDAYRYTTVYVTHDQSEAMTTADLIAVMNGGRIEQLGIAAGGLRPPVLGVRRPLPRRQQYPDGQALRRQPLSRSPARPSRASAPALTRRRRRRHLDPPARDRIDRRRTCGDRRTPARPLVRNVFLGATRDYVVEIATARQLRVTAAAASDLAAGSAVRLQLATGTLPGTIA